MHPDPSTITQNIEEICYRIFKFNNYDIRTTEKTFLFVGHLILCLVGRAIQEFKIPTNYFFTFKSNILYNLKSMNSSVHKHVHHIQTKKLSAHEIK